MGGGAAAAKNEGFSCSSCEEYRGMLAKFEFEEDDIKLLDSYGIAA